MRKVMAAALLAATVLAPVAANAQDGGRQGGWHGRDGGGRPGGRRPDQGRPAPQPPAQPPQVQAQAQVQPQFRPGGAGFGGRGRFGDGAGGGQRGDYAGQPGQLQGGAYGQRGQFQGRPGDLGQPGQPGQFQGRPGGYGQAGQGNGQLGGFRAPGSNGGRQFVQPAQGQFGRDRGRPDPGGYRGAYQGYGGRGGYGGYGGGNYRNVQGGYGNPAFNADRRDFARDQARFAGRADWNRGWRTDGRYNWNSYRQSHYDLFRLPRYEAPYGYGYGYRRFGIGARLSDIFFAEDYWIDDPYDYRLPPAYGPYRWVRYYGDALLVDIDTGEVVDTVYGIFD